MLFCGTPPLCRMFSADLSLGSGFVHARRVKAEACIAACTAEGATCVSSEAEVGCFLRFIGSWIPETP